MKTIKIKTESGEWKKTQISEESFRNIQDATTELIPVPEGIKIEETYIPTTKGLISPNGKCVLTASDAHGGTPRISYAGSRPDQDILVIPNEKLFLQPCSREDLKCGDVAFRCNSDNPPYSVIANYAIVLNKEEHAYWVSEMSMSVSESPWDRWWKLVVKD